MLSVLRIKFPTKLRAQSLAGNGGNGIKAETEKPAKSKSPYTHGGARQNHSNASVAAAILIMK